MRILKIALLSCIIFSLNTSCFKDKDDDIIINNNVNEINDFVYKAMNAVYLYKSKIPNLANDRFTSNEAYANYLNSYATPEELFESLIYQREVVDRFSIIAADGIALLQQLSGVFKSNGLEYLLYREPGSNTKVFGVIKIVLNNSVASNLGLKRGQIFNAVNGTQMTVDNYSQLLNSDSYTLNFATYNTNNTPITSDDTIVPTSESAKLTKEVYNENPVYLTKVIEINGVKIGYLVYNSFTADYNTQLNNAFAELKAGGAQHLVLDLRYNGGGSVNSAVLLGSMITGQFNGQVFSKLIYNEELQELNSDYKFTNTLNGGSALNSLNLQKVYVLTTNGSASASELIINSLKPYIEVVQIGLNTRGKTQASMPIYDSPDFGPNNVNPAHSYILLPLIANSVDKNGGLVPPTGLTPNIEIGEFPSTLGTLGDVNEPLLAAALNNITSFARQLPQPTEILKPLESTVDSKIYDGMMIVE
ncbi:S41 family peptidase [Gelidibacter sp.]|uniref:S41 family peptidase n=1 Tax=Gelidibacter sp. TaxID=2018083 RepID=UPI003265DA7C